MFDNNDNLNNSNSNDNKNEKPYREFSKEHSVETPFNVSKDNTYYDFSENKESNFDFTDDFNGSDSFSQGDAKKAKIKKPRDMKKYKTAAIALGLVLMCATSGVAGGYATYSFLGDTNSSSNSNSPAYTEGASVDNTNTPDNMSTNGSSGLTTSQIVENSENAVVGITSTTSQGTGYGSGFIFNKDGYLLTNYHVVEGATALNITFADGESATGKLINYDADLDLAVVQVQGDKKMPGILELGNSDELKTGEPVVAIGNPLGSNLQGTVTDGIISGLNRTIDNSSSGSEVPQVPGGNSTTENNKDTETSDDAPTYIQTNAAINPGNSGGPLLNSQGQVIGINTAKITSDSAEGLGFAIPINTAKEKIQDLLKPIITLGVTILSLDKETVEMYKAQGVSVEEGIYVKEVQDFSVAEKGGIKSGDYITKFDGKEVKTADELNAEKNKHEAGDTVTIEVNRNGNTKTLTLTLE